jgi:hypothetical protein
MYLVYLFHDNTEVKSDHQPTPSLALDSLLEIRLRTYSTKYALIEFNLIKHCDEISNIVDAFGEIEYFPSLYRFQSYHY